MGHPFVHIRPCACHSGPQINFVIFSLAVRPLFCWGSVVFRILGFYVKLFGWVQKSAQLRMHISTCRLEAGTADWTGLLYERLMGEPRGEV